MTVLVLTIVLAAVLVGAAAQRVTGMGLALIIAPFLVLAYGPFSGVLVVNFVATVSAGIVLVRVWSEIDWRNYLRLVVPAIVGIGPGVWLATVLSASWLELFVGGLLVLALSVSLVIDRVAVVVQGPVPQSTAGFISGMMSASAGIGGAAIITYAVLSRWNHRIFVATIQPYFFTIAALSLVMKLVLAPERWPMIQWWIWLLIGLVLVLGICLGDMASRKITSEAARRGVICIAFMGALFTIGKGLSGLVL